MAFNRVFRKEKLCALGVLGGEIKQTHERLPYDKDYG